MRLLVCGSRTWTGQVEYHRVADEILALEPQIVMHGGAKGADECADLWCRTPPEPTPVLVFRADWSIGHSAGPIRNARMLREGKPDRGLAFGALWRWDDRRVDPLRPMGGRGMWVLTGTGDMVSKALRARLPVRWIVSPDAPAVDLVAMPGPPR